MSAIKYMKKKLRHWPETLSIVICVIARNHGNSANLGPNLYKS